MSAQSASKQVTFPELDQLMIELGLNSAQCAKEAGISRNTLAKIVDGERVRVSTVAKVLASLSKNGHDVSEAETLLKGKLQPEKKLDADARVVRLSSVAATESLSTSVLVKRAVTSLEDAEDWLRQLERAVERDGIELDRETLKALIRAYRKVAISVEFLEADIR